MPKITCVNEVVRRTAVEDTYGDERAGDLRASSRGQSTIPNLLDLLTDRGEGEDASLGHGTIGTCEASMMAMIYSWETHVCTVLVVVMEVGEARAAGTVIEAS